MRKHTKIMKKILTIITSLFIGTGIISVGSYLIYENYKQHQLEEMSNGMQEIDMDEAITKFKNKESFVIYFGFPDCPNCQSDIPYIKQASEDTNVQLFYVRTRAGKDTNFEKLYSDKQKKEITPYIEDYMMNNEEGELSLYVPCVVSVIDGKAVDGHVGHVEGSHEVEKNSQESQKATNIYHNLFNTQNISKNKK